MKIVYIISMVLVIAIWTGCGPRPFYEGLRFGQEMECRKLQRSEQDECLKRSGMSYDEYERQLKKWDKEKIEHKEK